MKYLLIILGLIWAQLNMAQVNRYSVAQPAKDNYFNTNSQMSNADLFELYQMASSLHERNAKVVDAMIDNLYDLKGQVDNISFKNKLDEFLKQLKNLRLGSLVDAELKIKQIDWAIRDEIEKFKDGKYSAASREATTFSNKYKPGEYYKVVEGGILRDSPDINGRELNKSRYPAVRVLARYDERYFRVEVDQVQAYISYAFLGEKITKEEYNSIYYKFR